MSVSIPVLNTIEIRIPPTFGRLYELAYNMWWAWDPTARNLWPAIHSVAWERYHNPVELLGAVDPSAWQALEGSDSFNDRYNEVIRKFANYMAGEDTWWKRHHQSDLTGPIAYLCTEYGVHSSVPFYSGGLGVLAGDHVKAASDLGLPFVAVGLLYRRGYFQQEVDSEGEQQHTYPELDMTRLPIRPVASSTGGQCKIPIQFPGRTVLAAAWCLQVGRAPIILLDTDIADNEPADRPITHTLYIRGREMRFCQELVLGVGAVRLLAAQSIEPAVWHVNEGHAAMSLLERISVGVKGGASLEVAEKEVRSRTVFTLHTPVQAGNEVFEFTLAEKYLAPWVTSIKTDMTYLARLGATESDQHGRFDLGAMAIRLAALVNGVSKRHAEVVSRDWSHLLNAPAFAITNGVHTPTWMGRDLGRELAKLIGPDWPTLLVEHPDKVEAIDEMPNEELWASHLARKQLFTRFARGRFRRQFARHGSSPDELRSVERMLPPDRLTLGFARRFATYKRATLMFHNVPWLQAILTNPDRPVQVVFAGKAHPADRPGQDFIRHIVELSRSPELRGHIYIMENYDHRVARFLVQGVDVWVNNPRPPEEASGTSGMKAAINGAINASVLDGWWAEAFDGDNGWAFGSASENHDHSAQDNADAIAFYRLLQDEIVPLFYQRDEQGVPQQWVELMKRSMKSTLVAFSTQRMVEEYAELAYLKVGK